MHATKSVFYSLVALALSSGTISAQDRATSDTRVVRHKHATTTRHIDTVYIERRVQVPGPVRVDTVYRERIVQVAAAPLPARITGTPYIGVSGDIAFPVGDFRDGYKTGWGVTVPIGYKFANSPFGVRADLGYHRFEGKGAPTGSPSDTKIWSGKANLTVDVPFISTPGRTNLYVLGGVGGYDLRQFSRLTPAGTYEYMGDDTWEWGYNAGAGLAVGLTPRTSAYVESQFVSIQTDRRTNFVPVSLGIRIF